MSSTLSEGVRVPDIGSVNWGADVNFNWGLLNTALANISGNVKVNVANTWTATQTFTETISGSIDGIAARAVGDEDGNNIKTALAGKQPSLSQSQLDAVNSGVTASAVQQIGTNASNISGLQTAVSSKAADSDVVHLAGAETISGDKTWTGLNTFQYTVVFKDAAAVSAGGYGVGLGFFDYAGNRYGYIQPHIMSDGTKNIVFANSASGYLEFSSPLVPYASGVLPLGTNTFRWNGIYDANSIFVYNGYIFGTTPTSNKYWGLWCRDNAGVEVVGFLANARTSGSNSAWIRCVNTDGTNVYDRHIELVVIQDGTTQFIPNATGVFDLGRASAKWKTLNGINPGALSLPSTPTVDIDTTNWDKRATNGVIGSVTPSMDGWINVQIQRDVDFAVWPIGLYRQLFRAGAQGNGKYLVMIMLPVTKNVTVNLYTLPLGASESDLTFGAHKFYPCLGNV